MIFKRKKKAADMVQPITLYVECRSWYGVSFHIRDTRDDDHLALCGYEPLDDRSPVTFSDFTERAKHQHEGWKYCSACARIFTLMHDDEQTHKLISETYDRSPGRWCDRCQSTGSHHTDRHDHFVKALVMDFKKV